MLLEMAFFVTNVILCRWIPLSTAQCLLRIQFGQDIQNTSGNVLG
jgi:hypothetical protein